MVNYPIYAVMLAGGYGKRLWPLSTRQCPKQFLPGLTGKSLLYETWQRARLFSDYQWIVTHQEQVHLIQDIFGCHILKEPLSKNTAAAITYALLEIYEQSPEAYIVIMPSDHYISDNHIFRNTIIEALYNAQKKQSIVLIGVQPQYPTIDYGYIVTEQLSTQLFKVNKFEEKPKQERANTLSMQKNVFWNTGMIIASVKLLLHYVKQYIPDNINLITNYRMTGDINYYQMLNSLSFDRAVFEKEVPLFLVPALYDWSDIGSLESFIRMHQPKQIDNNLIYTQKPVVTLGIDNLCVIETAQAIFIAPRQETYCLHTWYLKKDTL